MENVDIWRVPIEAATGLAHGALERVTDNPGVDLLLNASADGQRLAFRSSRTGRDEIWIKDLTSGAEHQVTRTGVNAAELSPDARHVAAWGTEPEMNKVEIVDAREGRATILCDDCDRAFGWSPDGTRLLIARVAPSRLFMRDVARGRETLLAAHPTWHLRQARFSPDGRWVSFYATETPEKRVVYVIPATPNVVPVDAWIPIGPEVASQPSWSADGSRLYFISERDGAICAWAQPLDPLTKRPVGSAQPFFHFHDPRLRAGTAAIATTDVHGGYFYITLTETPANVWMLDTVERRIP